MTIAENVTVHSYEEQQRVISRWESNGWKYVNHHTINYENGRDDIIIVFQKEVP